MSRCLLGALALLAGVQSAQAQGGAGTPAAPPARPSLIVLLTVDQMRADYLDRFGPQLGGGLARLVRGGARFTNAHHDHAITETAPGHATLLSGRFPRSTNIWSNWAGVEDPGAPLIGGAVQPGASPARFRGTTLVDWLRAGDPRTRALSVSAKDRSAILPVGRAREQVYWYVPDGRFTTSTYYAESLPSWVRAFNDRHSAQRHAGQAWTLALPDTAYPERDSVEFEAGGQDVTFPHEVPADSAAAASYVRVTPWIDEIVLGFALEGLRSLPIGRGPQTDVLNVSLSATDFIGHRYGPDSREMHDQVVRLDRVLGTFVDSLYRLRDSTRVALVLTADHGVASIPELAPSGAAPAPARVDLQPLIGRMHAALRAAAADTGTVIVEPPIVLLNRPALKRARVNADSLLDRLAADARQVPGVLRVDRWRDLLKADQSTDAIARRWVHQFPADAAIELVLTLTPGSVWRLYAPVATHGSPHDYDTRVPLIFYGPAFRPGRYEEFVRTVDLAPTLAATAGVKPGEPVDGVVLRRILR
jgi:predicted AlkP superfamily pyrophosphatase or phosphodiesterase